MVRCCFLALITLKYRLDSSLLYVGETRWISVKAAVVTVAKTMVSDGSRVRVGSGQSDRGRSSPTLPPQA